MEKTFLFDLNGTMIDDMYYHAKAWDDLLKYTLQVSFSWEELTSNMYGKNNEVLYRLFGPDRFSDSEVVQLSDEKEKRYQQLYKPLMQPIDGLLEFLEGSSVSQVQLAIGSAAIPANIDFVVDGLGIRHYFRSIVSAHDVVNSKPDPETFLRNAEQLGLRAQDCLVFEDAPKGVEAALRAGMQCVVITTTHKRDEFSGFDNVIDFIADYRNISPLDIFRRK